MPSAPPVPTVTMAVYASTGHAELSEIGGATPAHFRLPAAAASFVFDDEVEPVAGGRSDCGGDRELPCVNAAAFSSNDDVSGRLGDSGCVGFVQ